MKKLKIGVVYWISEGELALDGGSLRIRNWLEVLRGLGHDVDVIPLLQNSSEYSGKKSFLHRFKSKILPIPFQRKFEIDGDFDLVVATVPAAFKCVSETFPRDQIIFDWMDLWSDYSLSFAKTNLLMLPGSLFQFFQWRLLEKKLVTMPKVNFFAGYLDLQRSRASDKGVWLPSPVHQPKALARVPSPGIRIIGFLGNFNHRPNLLSLNWFLKKYGRQLRSHSIELHVAGVSSEKVAKTFGNIKVLGKIDNLSTFYSSIDAVVVPIVFGGGIKVKAIEAFAENLPVFGTQEVALGFSPDLREYINPIENLFAKDKPKVNILQSDDFRKNFSPASFRDKIKEFIN